MKDNLIDCPSCEQKACCYESQINEVYKAYACFGCGYTSNDLMKEPDFDFEEFESVLPELYIDIKNTDSEGRVWYPQALNLQGKGTVFASGKTKEEWQWSAIKSVPLTEEEKKMDRFKGQNFKSDSKSLENFGKDFVEACDYIGFFDL